MEAVIKLSNVELEGSTSEVPPFQALAATKQFRSLSSGDTMGHLRLTQPGTCMYLSKSVTKCPAIVEKRPDYNSTCCTLVPVFLTH